MKVIYYDPRLFILEVDDYNRNLSKSCQVTMIHLNGNVVKYIKLQVMALFNLGKKSVAVTLNYVTNNKYTKAEGRSAMGGQRKLCILIHYHSRNALTYVA